MKTPPEYAAQAERYLRSNSDQDVLKGQGYATLALASAAAKRPHRVVELVVIPDGPLNMEALEKFARDLQTHLDRA